MLNEKQQASLKRLGKKLTALRQTLRKDERELLDVMLTGSSEVEGHVVFNKPKKGGKKVAQQAAEVEGHAAGGGMFAAGGGLQAAGGGLQAAGGGLQAAGGGLQAAGGGLQAAGGGLQAAGGGMLSLVNGKYQTNV